MRTLTGLAATLVAAIALAGCSEEKAEVSELPPRAIKYMTIDALADKATRQLAGIVKAGTSTNAAFEIGGSITLMSKKVGETVKKGEVIAKLDPKSIELEVRQSEFSLKQALSTLADTKAKLAQQQQLHKKRFTTKTALDTARANYENAEGQVGIARSQLSLKKRDLKKTELMAPFDGTISKKMVEVFEEIKAGEAVYTVQTEGENEVEVSVPETLIGFVKVGNAVEVSFPPLGNGNRTSGSVNGLITEVSPEAGGANAFPVTVRLQSSPEGLRPGMSAEITLSFKREETAQAYSVPVGALKPDVNAQQGTVFVFDPETKTVRQKPVRVVGIKGNNPEIVGDIKPGDIIATAGVGQMYDGMKVRLLDQKNLF